MAKKNDAVIEFECACKVRVVNKKDLPDYPWVTNQPIFCLKCKRTISVKDVSGDN